MHAGPSSVPSWVGPRRGSSAEPAQSVEHQCHNGNGEPRRKGPVEESLLEIMVTPRQVDAVSDRDDASTSQETHQQATMSIKGVEACCGQDPGWLAEAASMLAGASKHRPLASIAVDGGQVDAETVAGVHVAVRLRPFHGKEDQSRALEVRRSSKDQSAEVVLQGVSHPFPAVFEREDNEALHLRVGRRLVDSILEGYNGTLLAYGQTGSGKTYTLGEADLTGTPREGLMPRMLRDLFSSAAALPQSEFTFELRYVQVYLETIYDLLGEATSSSDQPIVTMRENACSVQLQGCSVVQLQSVEEALRALETGARRLRFASTQMNRHSSRSHAVCLLDMRRRERVATNATLQAPPETNLRLAARLTLCDLAGSESVRRTNATGVLLQEQQKINQSLLSLGSVVNALTRKGLHPAPIRHVPFRNSQLTRLLQPSLGGNCRTAMLICLSPSAADAIETRTSLDFASRAVHIRNHITRNVSVDFDGLAERLHEQLQSALAEGAAAAARHAATAQEAAEALQAAQRVAEEAVAAAEAKAARKINEALTQAKAEPEAASELKVVKAAVAKQEVEVKIRVLTGSQTAREAAAAERDRLERQHAQALGQARREAAAALEVAREEKRMARRQLEEEKAKAQAAAAQDKAAVQEARALARAAQAQVVEAQQARTRVEEEKAAAAAALAVAAEEQRRAVDAAVQAALAAEARHEAARESAKTNEAVEAALAINRALVRERQMQVEADHQAAMAQVQEDAAAAHAENLRLLLRARQEKEAAEAARDAAAQAASAALAAKEQAVAERGVAQEKAELLELALAAQKRLAESTSEIAEQG